jgi:hypothetical protein
VGSVEIFTAMKAFAAASPGSLKPKSDAPKVYDASSRIVTAAFAPAGASLSAVTLMVIVAAEASRSTPAFAVPPSSRTWKLQLAYPAPLTFRAGVNTRLPAAMSAALTNCPALTPDPASVRLPATGSVDIFTAASAFAAASFGSVKPKSSALKT